MKIKGFLLGLSLLNLAAQAQDDLADFLIADLDDASLLVNNYMSPIDKGFGYAASTGWYNTAKTHSMGFDLTAIVSAAFIPSEAHFTQFIESQYKDLELISPADNNVPTVFGPEDINPQYRVVSTGDTFEAPAGNDLEEEFGYEAIPFPIVQLGIGVIPYTDVKFRFMPLLEYDDDFETKMWGVGIQHHINNYFPSGDELLLDLSVFAGYTSLSSEINITDTYPGDDQLGIQGLNVWNIDGIVSYDLSVFTFFGALGYNRVTSNLELRGTYDIGNEILQDPIDTKTNYSGIKATVGLRIKVAIITLHGEYTYNDYSVVSAGFGLNVN